jgi:yecA family protein
MDQTVHYDELDEALRRCGATWDAAQTHGLLSGRLAIAGSQSGFDWLTQVLEGTNPTDPSRSGCEVMLGALFESTYRQLSERQSKFEPLLPDDADSAAIRAAALGRWCEGFLHGLVSSAHADALKERLSNEPMADIIRDMLQITRATVDDDSEDESNEQAYAELVEYLRVAAQLTYEELVEFRGEPTGDGTSGGEGGVLH